MCTATTQIMSGAAACALGPRAISSRGAVSSKLRSGTASGGRTAGRASTLHVCAASKPKLLYMKIRGRGEPIRLALSYAGVDYEDTGLADGINRDEMKAEAGQASWPFGQCPVFQDGGFRLGQSDAILRYIARQHGLYGSGAQEEALIDSFLQGVEDLRKPYVGLIYVAKLDAAAMSDFEQKHVDPASKSGKNGGAHFAFLESFLKRNGGGGGFVVGGKLSIADIQLFDLMDIFLREPLFPKQLRQHYPALVAHHEQIASMPKIAEYLVRGWNALPTPPTAHSAPASLWIECRCRCCGPAW